LVLIEEWLLGVADFGAGFYCLPVPGGVLDSV